MVFEPSSLSKPDLHSHELAPSPSYYLIASSRSIGTVFPEFKTTQKHFQLPLQRIQTIVFSIGDGSNNSWVVINAPFINLPSHFVGLKGTGQCLWLPMWWDWNAASINTGESKPAALSALQVKEMCTSQDKTWGQRLRKVSSCRVL